MEYSKIIFATFVLLGLIYGVLGHSYVTSPITRSNQKQSNTGCRGPNCLGPCDAPLSSKNRAPIVIARGDKIVVEWPRNNHAGGFIRLAWAPTSQSDSHEAFDNNVHQFSCHEAGGCFPDDASNPNGGDSGPGDGSSRACSSSLSVPSHLADGEWTLQWAWFGGAFALGDYYSCVDYKIVGGNVGSFTPSFIGGDYTHPKQQKCKFFNTDKLHVCTNEPCNNPIFPYSQEQSGAIDMTQYTTKYPSSNTASTPAAPATTAAKNRPAPAPATPSTTGRVATPAPSPVTPAKPSTTGATIPVVTPPVPVPVPTVTTPAPAASCAGSLVASPSRAVIANMESWNDGNGHYSYKLVVLLWVQETMLSNWMIKLSLPSAEVKGVFNAGELSCADASGSFIKSRSWSNNINAGSVQTIEVVVESNQNLGNDYVKANTQLNVFTRK